MEIASPLVLKMGNLMSEDQFFYLCQINEQVEFERDCSGDIVILSLRSSIVSLLNTALSAELWAWNEQGKTGVGFSSSTGFTLPNGAVRSPDVSWISNTNWNIISREDQEAFAPVCPDFVIEILSLQSETKYLHNKLREYISNGTRLGWLIDVVNNQVFIYDSNDDPVVENSLDITLSGGEILHGFSINPGSIINQSWR